MADAPPAAPQLPPAKNRKQVIIAATIRYAIGLSLCVIAFFVQDVNSHYVAPATKISVDTAATIAGVCVAGVGGSGFLIWYRYFKGRTGSVIGIFGLLSAGKEVGTLLARAILSFL